MKKVLKFDGKSLKEGSETLCHVDGKYIKIGASDSKTQLEIYNNFSPSTVY